MPKSPAAASGPGGQVPIRPPVAVGTRPTAPWLLLVLLVGLTVAAFWPVFGNVFVHYDDPEYLLFNKYVPEGLTWEGVRWAFVTDTFANWHPLTWISHMADVSLFGMNPAGHHATSLFLHVLNTLLVFTVLRRLTGETARSAWVAALFAVHPAHVQSVAWVAERKDVLSTVFGLATIWAYASWVRKRGAVRYGLVLLLFASGLMSKPMLVSLPLVLLLLDYWPLGRLSDSDRENRRGIRLRLLLEKLPLLLISAASSLVTFLLQHAGGATRALDLSIGARLANMVVAYVRYLKMLFWPSNLAVFYPHPEMSLSAPAVLGATLVLVSISVVAVRLRRRAPYFIVGWAWFLVTLVPVIGLVQVGGQAIADRYSYLSFLGPFVALAWGIPALIARWRFARPALRVGAVAISLVLALATYSEVRHWRNTETLLLRALAVTTGNYVAHNNLAVYYHEVGRLADGMRHSLESVRIRPGLASAHVNLGRSLFLLDRFDEAERSFRRALRLEPRNGVALSNLAETTFLKGEVRESVALYQAAVATAPLRSEPRRRLAIALLMEGKSAPALDELERAVALDPSDAEARVLLEGLRARERHTGGPAVARLDQLLGESHRNVGTALQLQGRRADAAVQLRKAIELFPADAHAHTNLGTILAQEGRADEAAAHFQQALRIDPGQSMARNNLGNLLLLQGHREAAIEQFREALRREPGFSLARENLERALREKDEESPPRGGSR
jgi:tetratricopeptide (TPR) repeat protein